jgi:hypothetical protein
MGVHATVNTDVHILALLIEYSEPEDQVRRKDPSRAGRIKRPLRFHYAGFPTHPLPYSSMILRPIRTPASWWAKSNGTSRTRGSSS